MALSYPRRCPLMSFLCSAVPVLPLVCAEKWTIYRLSQLRPTTGRTIPNCYFVVLTAIRWNCGICVTAFWMLQPSPELFDWHWLHASLNVVLILTAQCTNRSVVSAMGWLAPTNHKPSFTVQQRILISSIRRMNVSHFARIKAKQMDSKSLAGIETKIIDILLFLGLYLFKISVLS